VHEMMARDVQILHPLQSPNSLRIGLRRHLELLDLLDADLEVPGHAGRLRCLPHYSLVTPTEPDPQRDDHALQGCGDDHHAAYAVVGVFEAERLRRFGHLPYLTRGVG
jgi:hypothetical protein